MLAIVMQLRQCKLEQAKLEVQQRMAEDAAQAAKEQKQRNSLLERELKREQKTAECALFILNVVHRLPGPINGVGVQRLCFGAGRRWPPSMAAW